MTFEELKAMAAADAEIAESELDKQSLLTIKLYNKYQNLFHEKAKEALILKSELNKVKLRVQQYWLGQAPDEVYKEKPKQTKVLKTEVDAYIKADDEYIAASLLLDECELQVAYLDNYLKQLSGRNFAIKNAIDYIKFKNGGY